MFGNKILLLNFVKLSKNKVKHKAIMSLSSCKSKPSDLSHRKFSDCAFIKINGFGNQVLRLNRNSTENRNIEKYLSYDVLNKKCWKCNEEIKTKRIDCPSCGALQYPNDNTNFFQLLGVSQTYEINLEDLSRKFKNLQKILHPDKFVNKSPEELEISESYSRLLNKAYTTLKDPLSRGLYMLELLKIKSDENFEMEPDFLLFIMEKNEELECHSSLSSLSNFMQENSREMDKEINKISEAFRVNNTDQVKNSLMRLNYFINLDKKIKEKQRNLSAPND